MIQSIISGIKLIAQPVAQIYQKKQERKMLKESAKAKIEVAKVQGQNDLNLSAAEWEALSKQAESESWKDEYVTIIVTLPFVLLFLASVQAVLTGDQKLLDAVVLGIQNLKGLGVEIGRLMEIVVLAAVSIRGVKLFNK